MYVGPSRSGLRTLSLKYLMTPLSLGLFALACLYCSLIAVQSILRDMKQGLFFSYLEEFPTSGGSVKDIFFHECGK